MKRDEVAKRVDEVIRALEVRREASSCEDEKDALTEAISHLRVAVECVDEADVFGVAARR